MTYFFVFWLGIGIGVWITSYCFNRYYQSDIWEAAKAVKLEEFHVQQKRKEAQRTRYEKEIHDILDGRLKDERASGSSQTPL
jgi:hypothetical protein